MSISSGTHTVGGAAADYGDWTAAAADIAWPLIGDLTLIQIDDCFNQTLASFSGSLGGHKLHLTSNRPHVGRPFSGWITGTGSAAQRVHTIVYNGELEIDNLEFAAQAAGWKSAVVVQASGAGNLTALIHDILIHSNSYALADTWVALDVGATCSAPWTSFLNLWNVIVDVTQANGAGLQYGLQSVTSGTGNNIIYVDNAVFSIDGSNSNARAIYGAHSTGLARYTNVVALRRSTGGVGFSFSGPGDIIQYSCASDDASADDAPSYTNPYNNIVVANEFESTLASSFGLFFVPKASGQLDDGGQAPLIAENVAGIKRRSRPHNSGKYSVGAVEGPYAPLSSGTKTIGPDGDYTSLATAIASLTSSLTGDVTLTIVASLTEEAWVANNSGVTAIDLNGHKLTITSATPHVGDPTEAPIIAFSSGYRFMDLITINGTLELSYLNLRAALDLWNGLWIEHQSGTAKIHDLILIGENAYGLNAGVNPAYGLYVSTQHALIDIWNVEVDCYHTHPGLNQDTYSFVVYKTGSGTGKFKVENCSFRARETLSDNIDVAAAFYAQGDSADEGVFRNVLAVNDASGFPAFAKISGIATGWSAYNCAANDNSFTAFATHTNDYANIVLADELVTDSTTSGQFYFVPISGGTLENGATPAITENIIDIRGRARSGTGIGSTEPLPVHTGTSPFVTNFQVIPVIEGSQLLAVWSLPDDSDTTQLKLLRKLLNYSEDQTDGTELISSPIGSSPNYYVDLNVTPQQAWCYTAFVYHYSNNYWQASTFTEANSVIVPVMTTGFFYVSLTRGVTGVSEPTWPTEIGDTVTDGDVIWQCYATNPAWVAGRRSRGSAFSWDSEYMQRLPFRHAPSAYQNADRDSVQSALTAAQDSTYYNVWRAVHEDGTVKRGEFERFLLIFGAALSRIKGAIDFYPKLVDPDECLAQYLPFLAGLLGWQLNTTLPTAQQRQEILSAVPTYKTKGTVGGLEVLLRAATDVDIAFVDPMSHHILMSNRINRKSARGVEYVAYSSWVPLATVARGDIAIPTFANSTGYYYQAKVGGTASATEPTWPTVPGDDVTDGTVTWRCRQFGQPHLTANATAGGSSITVDDTSEFSAGQTVNIRDTTTPAGEEIVIATVPSSTSLTFETTLDNSYTMAAQATVTPAFDWFDDETGFIWDIPRIDDFAGIDPARVRVPGAILDDSVLYSFEFLRLWFILAPGESVSNIELERIATIMDQFAPADTRYVVRIEQV